MIALAELNALPADAFIGALQGIFEHSPWVPAGAAEVFAKVSNSRSARRACGARVRTTRPRPSQATVTGQADPSRTRASSF